MRRHMELCEVFSDEDIDPIPLGTRTGNLVHLTHITGADPASGALDAGIDAQMDQVHQNLKRAVEAADGSIDNIAQVSFFLKARTGLASINPAWIKLFPNDEDRPTYKFMVAPLLSGDCLVQVEAFAVLGSRRQVLHIPGVAHTNPIPMGVKIGDMLFSSRVLPYDAATGTPHKAFPDQARHLFQNLRTLLVTAGAVPANITQARLFIADKAQWPGAKHHWDALFGESEQPALRLVTYGTGTGLQIYIEVIAHL
jgi:2-iminobutanoate/2-iminopropanoate deaminase